MHWKTGKQESEADETKKTPKNSASLVVDKPLHFFQKTEEIKSSAHVLCKHVTLKDKTTCILHTNKKITILPSVDDIL